MKGKAGKTVSNLFGQLHLLGDCSTLKLVIKLQSMESKRKNNGEELNVDSDERQGKAGKAH